MKTLANRNYALVEALPCRHTPFVRKATGECLACAKLRIERVTEVTSTVDGVSRLDVGGFLASDFSTEGLIYRVLLDRYGPERVQREVRLGATRMRADILLDRTTVIEFDGMSHYTNARTLVSDSKKAGVCEALGVRLIRVPFWVQLDREMAEHYGITDKFYLLTSFPHGWVATDVFPASFCEAGTARFVREFSGLPASVRQAVAQSLQECVQGRDEAEVWTPTQKAQVLALC